MTDIAPPRSQSQFCPADYQNLQRLFVPIIIAAGVVRPSDRDEFVHEAIIRVWTCLPRYDHKRPYTAFARGILKKVTLEYLHGHYKQTAITAEDFDRALGAVAEGSPSTTENLDVELIGEVLEGLSGDERQLARLLFDQTPSQEIQSILRITPDALYQRKHRLLKAVREMAHEILARRGLGTATDERQ